MSTGRDSLRHQSQSRFRAYVEVSAFVGLWMAAGLGLHADANSYLLMGVPLLVIFQVAVRKRSLARLWVFTAYPPRWSVSATALAIAFAVLPATLLFRQLNQGSDVSVTLWMLCAIAGAVPAAYAVSRQERHRTMLALPNTLSVIVVGMLVMAMPRALSGALPAFDLALGRRVLEDAAAYFPVTFVLEEVAFRGAVDQHVSENRTTGAEAWGSAAFVSALWGLWHFPIIDFPVQSNPAVVGLQIVAFHVGIGCLLSLAARQSGTLALPAAAHAVLDGWRNGILA